MYREKENPLKEKSYAFALKIARIVTQIQLEEKEYVLSKQLLRAGTSIGANVEEALAGQSKRDFTAKMSISSKEARETKYWLRLLKQSELTSIDVNSLILDIDELIRILTSIFKTSQQNLTKN